MQTFVPAVFLPICLLASTVFGGVGAIDPPAGEGMIEGLRGVVLTTPAADSLRRWHDLLGERPHVAGTPGDRVVISAIAGAFEGMGLETEVWWFEPLLARPISASLTIVSDDDPVEAPNAEPTGDSAPRRRRGVMPLAITEDELLNDPSTRHPDLSWGWNAYSASGVVEAGVVYANRGTREDFARLRELGVDCTGRIVLARYGGNYRGFKAKFAEEAGAAGLVVYTDPGDSGDDRGPVWPDGGWANATCIQRGSMLTLPYKGDPLTPGVPSLPGVPRLDPDEVGLPTIPIQPIGYAAATRIMAAMTGPTLAEVKGWDGWDGLADWAGGLDVPYRLDGGDLRLRLEVQQVRAPMPTANVLGTLRGAERPDELVIVGCHHDAWGFGAADPLAGTIVLMETARAFAVAAEHGLRPRRSVVFAAWGAEEFGIIGSSEWVEANRDRLGAHAVAYLNLDMAAMGTNFGASATPSLAAAVVEAAGLVPQPRGAEDADAGDVTVASRWAGERGTAACGDLGGGSDHVGFLCHVGVPCVSLHAGGSRGTSYHSNYDTLTWYRSTVGDDYAGALMLARITAALATSLADRPVPPIDPTAIVEGLPARLDRLDVLATEAGLTLDTSRLRTALASATTACREATSRIVEIEASGHAEAIEGLTTDLLAFERVWLDGEGLPGRAWFANTFAASDRDSGYGAVVLPLLAEAIRDRDQAAMDRAVERYRLTIERIRMAASAIGASGG